MKLCREVKGKQVITLQMAQQLKAKNIDVVPAQLFCRQCKATFFFRDIRTVSMIKIKFNLLQILIINSLNVKHQGKSSISPASLHEFMKALKSDISEAYKVQVDCLKDSESDSYDKNDMKVKGCTRQCKKN